MEKRLVIAIALSIMIVLTFQFLTPHPTVIPQAPGAISTTVSEPIKKAEIAQAAFSKAEEQELRAETDKYIVTFSNIGAAIKGITLKKFKASNSNENLVLVNLTNPSEYLLNINSTTNPEIDTAAYSAQKLDNAVVYTLNTKELQIIKKYILQHFFDRR